ncbi:MAG: DUF1501 domain-containing protein [Betaproteobacteria bacterium]|nr:DUF1501 domain-containing protein [Betaproteobacteria bacterium]
MNPTRHPGRGRPGLMPAATTLGRRGFLARSGALMAGGLATTLGLLPLRARAQAAADYKALVCVFLYGGSDGNNLLVPLDSAGYGQYAAVRGAGSGIALTQAELLPIQPRNSGTPYGLHPALKELQPLFGSGELALLANVGTLTQPTTKADYTGGTRPENLYSHSDQQAQWQTAVATTAARTGWGGRLADVTAARVGGTFPVITSTAGVTLFATGNTSRPLAIPTSGSFGLSGFGSSAAAQARLAALKSLLAVDRGNAFVDAASTITEDAIALSATVNPILTSTTSSVVPPFAGQTSGIAQQLLAVARMIEARGATGATRQVFFVSQGGYDTHNNQLATQAALFGQLSPALKAFRDAMALLGVGSQVTTFTLSEFGRTFLPAAGGGSDHAWGSHQLVLGGAVQGGSLYGRFPTLALAGPDDAEREGRWIPTTSLDQYGATLARWFGATSAELATVFPNLGRFATADLGFLG